MFVVLCIRCLSCLPYFLCYPFKIYRIYTCLLSFYLLSLFKWDKPPIVRWMQGVFSEHEWSNCGYTGFVEHSLVTLLRVMLFWLHTVAERHVFHSSAVPEVRCCLLRALSRANHHSLYPRKVSFQILSAVLPAVLTTKPLKLELAYWLSVIYNHIQYGMCVIAG